MSDLDDVVDALGVPTASPEYVPSELDRIPVEDWSKDHWSTFAYLETRIVDYCGRIAHDHMRCHLRRHPFMFAARRLSVDHDGSRYPTRLKSGELFDHDDYDCIDDMIAAGLVTVTMPPPPEGVLVTGMLESELMTQAVYGLTELGWAVAGQLREHMGSGGNYARFEPVL